MSDSPLDRNDVPGILNSAQPSLAAAICTLKVDHEAAVDDLLAARLLIATAAVFLAQGASLIG